MLGLPQKLTVNNISYDIATDYKVALLIFEAFNDMELNESEKCIVMLKCLYKEFNAIPEEDYREAIEQAIWFLDGGKEYKTNVKNKKLMDWEQDEQFIFSALNKVAGYEIREKDVHWWTFLGFFNELNEGLLSTIIHIRDKKNNGKKLEKYEEEFYNNNRDLIEIKKKYSIEEQQEIDKLNNIFK